MKWFWCSENPGVPDRPLAIVCEELEREGPRLLPMQKAGLAGRHAVGTALSTPAARHSALRRTTGQSRGCFAPESYERLRIPMRRRGRAQPGRGQKGLAGVRPWPGAGEHENVVRVYDTSAPDDDVLYLAMEYVA